jgi:hypothetical protein
MAYQYLVKVDRDHFILRIDGHEILTTTAPSVCEGLTYEQADAVLRRLRNRGQFRAAHITNTLGELVTAEMLRSDQA